MPRPPISYREAFYYVLADGSIRDHDFFLVNTSLGAMVETRSFSSVPSPFHSVDKVDASINRRTLMPRAEVYGLLGTAGLNIPVV